LAVKRKQKAAKPQPAESKSLEKAGERVVRAIVLLDEADDFLAKDGEQWEFARGALYSAHVALCSLVDFEEEKPKRKTGKKAAKRPARKQAGA
jgi:hypothetical protein